MIIKQAFPEPGNDKLVKRLYDTANKTGIYTNRSIYGQRRIFLDGVLTAFQGHRVMALDSLAAPFYPT